MMIDYNKYLILSDKVAGFAGDYAAYQNFREVFEQCELIYKKKNTTYEYNNQIFEIPFDFADLENAVESINDGIFNSSAVCLKRIGHQFGIRRL